MTAPELLETIKARGAAITARGTGAGAWLQVAPRGVLTDGDRAAMRQLTPELLELLTRPLDGAGVHRWRDATATGDLSAPDETGAPDVAALVRELEAARRGIGGAWVTPLPRLLALWRELQTFTGAKLTARHLGALATLHETRPDLANGALLGLWRAGLQPDGDGAAVWRDLEQIADETHAAAKVAAQQNNESK